MMATTTPAAACTVNLPAKIVHAVAPDFPDIARQQGTHGLARIAVDLDRFGLILRARVYRSTGNAALDRAAIKAARASQYAVDAALSRRLR